MNFKQLPLGQPIALDNPGLYIYNEVKNRYTNILPSQSAVTLSNSNEIVNGDYINADWVTVDGLSQKYILTQEPLSSTVGDFWKMIWECRAKLIVALVTEQPTYALGSKPARYGQLSVRCVGTRKLQESLYIHDYELMLEGKPMTVHLLHSKGWPDFGTPSLATVDSLLYEIANHRVNPIVIHCTAGVGRSGMLCLLDAALQLRVRSEDSLLRLLEQIRQHRRGAVSNEKQFQFVVDYLVAFAL